jgi:hypothetical protein
MTDLVLHVTNEQRQHIEEIARQQGYDGLMIICWRWSRLTKKIGY